MTAIGFNHAQAGARLGEKWRLPEEMIAAIKYHHAPDSAGPHQNFVRCIALGVHAAATLTVSDAKPALANLHRLAEKWFGVNDAQVDGLLAQITDDARDIARLFRVPTGQAPDINQIVAQAEEATLKHQFEVQREAETLRQTNSDLARMALTDGLTGAGNRNFFDTELHRLFAQSRATGNPMAVIMVDADKFKSLNDTYGHQVGDAVLIEIAWRMKNTAANCEGTLVCRYGGEEFAILLPSADRRSAAQLAENVRTAIAAAPVALRTGQPCSKRARHRQSGRLGVRSELQQPHHHARIGGAGGRQGAVRRQERRAQLRTNLQREARGRRGVIPTVRCHRAIIHLPSASHPNARDQAQRAPGRFARSGTAPGQSPIVECRHGFG